MTSALNRRAAAHLRAEASTETILEIGAARPLREIAQELVRLGVPTERGGQWHPATGGPSASEEFLAELRALYAMLVSIEPIGQELQDLRGTLPEIPDPPQIPDLSAILGATDLGIVESPAMPDLIPT